MAALVDYSESSSEEYEAEGEGEESQAETLSAKKLSNCSTVDIGKGCVMVQEPDKKKSKIDSSALPMPKEVLGMFENQDDEATRLAYSDPTQHNGRKRTFAHVEGNWATFVYLPYGTDEYLIKLRDELFKCLRLYGEFQPMDDHHVSLSRTVVIRHHWIEPLVCSLREEINDKVIKRCVCKFCGVKFYTNDEKTRSFVGLTIEDYSGVLKQLTEVVDQAFSEYRLPPYYKNTSYHLSIGWVLGDITTSLSSDILSQLQDIMTDYCKDEPGMRSVSVEEICVKTGNKIFTCPLYAR